MLFLKLSFSYMNDTEIPVGLSRGVLYSLYNNIRYPIDLVSIEVLDKPYYDQRYWSGHFLTFTGAFCAKNDGQHSFQFRGKGGFWFKGGLFEEASGDKTCGSTCANIGYTQDCSPLHVNLKKGTCYPFSFEVCTGSFEIVNPYQIRTSYNSSEYEVWDDYVQNTNEYHCMKEYYGNMCEKCTVKCGLNGFCGGLERNAEKSLDRCNCTNGSNDPFCRDMEQRPSTGKSAGLHLELIENFGTGETIDKKVIGSNENIGKVIFTEPYARVSVSGLIMAPQLSKYAIRVKTTNSAKISLKGSSSAEISTDYRCELSLNRTNIVSTNVVSADADELMPFNLDVDTECSLKETTFELEWCFYRYYTDRDIVVDLNNDTFWEPIPYIYLFH